jgi:hypothetical protein
MKEPKLEAVEPTKEEPTKDFAVDVTPTPEPPVNNLNSDVPKRRMRQITINFDEKSISLEKNECASNFEMQAILSAILQKIAIQ